MLLHTILICLPMLAFGQSFLAQEVFNRFDFDGNGDLEPREIERYFAEFDKNGDRQISRQEYNDEVATHHAHNPQAVQALNDLFNELDLDGDNFLERSDFDRLFRQADANGNGIVNLVEFSNHFHSLTGGAPIVVG